MTDKTTEDAINRFLASHFLKSLTQERAMSHLEGDSSQDNLWGRYEVSCTFDEPFFVDGLLSLRFGYYNHWSGAAHPNYDVETFLFSWPPLRMVTLSELFAAPPEEALQYIAEACCRALCSEEDGDSNWIREGTSADWNNFRRFTLSQRDLTIHFGPEQVGPYLWGPKSVRIELDSLRSYFEPRGPSRFCSNDSWTLGGLAQCPKRPAMILLRHAAAPSTGCRPWQTRQPGS